MRTDSQQDTAALGQALSAALAPGDSVLLRGALGTGKSVLARGIARGLGVTSPMPSPTFTLMQPYPALVNVCHFDLYRLADMDEFEAAGLFEYIGGDWVALIEWPLDGLDAAPCVSLTLTRGETENIRFIELMCRGVDEARVCEAVGGWEVRI